MSILNGRVACAALLGALAAAPLAAQPAIVFATNSETGEILKVDFEAGTTEVVNSDAGLREGLGALAVRDDGGGALHLIVCDTEADEVLFYADAQGAGQTITGTIKRPNGVSILANGELVVANSRKYKGGASRALYRIARDCPSCPGGYGTVSLIDGAVPAKEIPDTRIVPLTAGALTTGDLLVVTREPSRVFRYPGGSGPRQVFIDTGGGLPSSSGPTGLAFAPDGTLLIGTSRGAVLRFDANGQRLTPDFVAGLGRTRLRLAAGLDDGVERVFVSDEEGERLLRYDVAPDGIALQPPAVVSLGEEPGGIAVATPAPQQISVPVGTNITLQATSEYEIKLEQVVGAGLLGVRTFLFPDPDPGDPDRTVLLSDVDPELPARVIPKHVRAFDLSGVPTFLLLLVDSTAVLRRTQQHHIDEVGLGFATDCASGPQPRTFYATDVDDAPIVEGAKFTDISTGCGSNIGRGGQTSLILTGYDTRSVEEVAEDKIERLEKALRLTTPASEGGLAGFIASGLRDELKELLEEAEDAFESGDEAGAIAKLEEFIAGILANPGSFDNSQRNVAGELEARAQSAIFMVCGATAPACNRELAF
jgi:hypothetical protein